MAFDVLAQKYLRPSLMVFSDTQPTNTSTEVIIESIQRTGTSPNKKIEYTTSSAHGFSVKQAVTISNSASPEYNFTTPQIITNVTSNTFSINSEATGGTTSTAKAQNLSKWDLGSNYLYISDNNRAELAVSFERIEYKQRMINGTMRSYHVADKKNFSTSWEKLPSRKTQVTEYDADSRNKFAGGQELLRWYEQHTGDFWMLLVYDFDASMPSEGVKNNIEVVNVFFGDFSYNVVDRGQDTDLWNINLSLVEV
jgi:hypothetical protein